MSYAELHCLSNYSFLRGASHAGELVQRAYGQGYAALAITDECSMAGVVKAHAALRELKRERPFKLIVGAEFHVRGDAPLSVVLLAPNHAAYSQICRLITLGRRASKKGGYRLERKHFETGLDECLALWLPPPEATAEQAAWIEAAFPRRGWLAVELHRDAGDAARWRQLEMLGRQSGLPLVAAGDVHMHVRRRRILQDTLTAIRHGCTLAEAGYRLFPNGERHLRPLEQLSKIYPAELLAETLRIAERCRFTLDQLHYEYPHELVPAGLSATRHLRNLTEAGIGKRWPQGIPEKVRATIEKELVLIAALRYEHFFLTVHDVVEYARSRNILCQGRGSAANSAVCYALGITAVDPGRAELLFERFISKERNEPPDIDVDFEHERREEVIQYIYGKYGRERAAIAATVITYRPRSAIRDVGKALGIGVDVIDRLTKNHVWWEEETAFRRQLRRLGLAPRAPGMRLLGRLVKDLVGFPRHLSQHVGGFVISEHPLSRLVPIENAAMPDRTVIQWDKDDLESLGLLKVDVLALGILTALRKTLEMLRRHGIHLRMEDIPDQDPETYDMICEAGTVGVFQIESRAQMSMLPRLKPRSYYDLVVQVAIVRPGPIQGDMVHPYLQRRKEPSSVTYPSEALRKVLERTYGVPIFQEQVMQIAVVAAGFTPGEADQLRRAMAAWKRKGGLEPFRERLMSGMLERGYEAEFAERIYRQILGFGEYGFPESHAASFALLAYNSAWLKRHHPAAFIAGLVNSQPMGFYQPAQLTQEARRMGVDVRPVDVLKSEWDCTVEPEALGLPALRLGMRLVRGLAEPDAERILAARAAQSFESLEDLARRTGLTKRTIGLLALGGALRSLAINRRAAWWHALGVERLPGMLAGHSAPEAAGEWPPPSEGEEIVADYASLGLTTGRHPLALLRSRLKHMGISSSAESRGMRDGSRVKVCGLITHLQHPDTASGVLFMSLEDETGVNNIVLWSSVFEANRRVALEASCIVARGVLQNRENVVHVVAEELENCSQLIRGLERSSRDFQ